MADFNPSPFIKWVGGKGQLVDRLLQIFPSKVDVYYETFLGGGAAFWALTKVSVFNRAVLNDNNQELVIAYQVVRDNPTELMAQLDTLKYDKEMFLVVRAQDPLQLNLIERAARMIYLNKTCFNGLYRVNKAGKFNVPFGKYTNPRIYKESTIQDDSIALKRVQLTSGDFEIACGPAKSGDLVYFDPPYVPLNATSNFTAYTSDGFDIRAQARLANLFRKLSDKGVSVVTSNSNTDVVRGLYKGFDIIEVGARRGINCKSYSRGPIKELIITNYATPLPED